MNEKSFESDDYTLILKDLSDRCFFEKSLGHENKFDVEHFISSGLSTNLYGVFCELGNSSCCISANGGASTVLKESAIIQNSTAWIAIGNQVVSLTLPSLKILWHKQVDSATCFQIFESPDKLGILVHGELEISKISFDGEILWSRSGKDIFSGSFEIFDEYLIVEDFNEEKYKILIASGKISLL